MKKIDPCKKFACRIQDCLKNNNFQENSCLEAIEDMKDCCRKWGEESFVCGGFKTESNKSSNKKEV